MRANDNKVPESFFVVQAFCSGVVFVRLAFTGNFLMSHNTLGHSSIVSMLTHTCSHIPLRKIKVDICNHQADCPFTCGLMSDLVSCKQKIVWACMTLNILTETRC